MTGLTHVLYRVILMLVLSLLFGAISGYSLLRSGCARIDLACMAGAQETLESRTTPRYFALCAQGMGCPDMLISVGSSVAFLVKVIACVLWVLIVNFQC